MRRLITVFRMRLRLRFRERYEPIEAPDPVLSTSLLVAFDVVTVSFTAYLVMVYVMTFVWDQLPGVVNWYWIPVILLVPLALWLIVRLGEFPPGSAGQRLRLGAAGILTVAFIFYSLAHVGYSGPNPAQVVRDGGLFFERVPLGDRVLITAADYHAARLVDVRDTVSVLLAMLVFLSMSSWVNTNGRARLRADHLSGL
jgi:hypothetical protein